VEEVQDDSTIENATTEKSANAAKASSTATTATTSTTAAPIKSEESAEPTKLQEQQQQQQQSGTNQHNLDENPEIVAYKARLQAEYNAREAKLKEQQALLEQREKDLLDAAAEAKVAEDKATDALNVLQEELEQTRQQKDSIEKKDKQSAEPADADIHSGTDIKCAQCGDEIPMNNLAEHACDEDDEDIVDDMDIDVAKLLAGGSIAPEDGPIDQKPKQRKATMHTLMFDPSASAGDPVETADSIVVDASSVQQDVVDDMDIDVAKLLAEGPIDDATISKTVVGGNEASSRRESLPEAQFNEVNFFKIAPKSVTALPMQDDAATGWSEEKKKKKKKVKNTKGLTNYAKGLLGPNTGKREPIRHKTWEPLGKGEAVETKTVVEAQPIETQKILSASQSSQMKNNEQMTTPAKLDVAEVVRDEDDESTFNEYNFWHSPPKPISSFSPDSKKKKANAFSSPEKTSEPESSEPVVVTTATTENTSVDTKILRRISRIAQNETDAKMAEMGTKHMNLGEALRNAEKELERCKMVIHTQPPKVILPPELADEDEQDERVKRMLQRGEEELSVLRADIARRKLSDNPEVKAVDIQVVAPMKRAHQLLSNNCCRTALSYVEMLKVASDSALVEAVANANKSIADAKALDNKDYATTQRAVKDVEKVRILLEVARHEVILADPADAAAVAAAAAATEAATPKPPLVEESVNEDVHDAADKVQGKPQDHSTSNKVDAIGQSAAKEASVPEPTSEQTQEDKDAAKKAEDAAAAAANKAEEEAAAAAKKAEEEAAAAAKKAEEEAAAAAKKAEEEAAAAAARAKEEAERLAREEEERKKREEEERIALEKQRAEDERKEKSKPLRIVVMLQERLLRTPPLKKLAE
jgi:hypothetical protein